MTSRILPSLMIGLAMGLTFLAPAQAAMSKLNMTVRIISVPDKTPVDKTGKDKKPVAELDQRKLAATLKNLSTEAMTGLQIRFFYLGHSVGATEIKILQKDTQSKDLASGEQAVVESALMAATYMAAHTTNPKKDSGEKAERVKATGEKFSGWAVQVVSGEALVAEAYSSPAMKVALGTDGVAAPKP